MPRDLHPNEVIDYLRREAPYEFERLKSIGHLVASWAEADLAAPAPRHPGYSTWLRETYSEPFTAPGAACVFRQEVGFRGIGASESEADSLAI